jgi:hypothetical protein
MSFPSLSHTRTRFDLLFSTVFLLLGPCDESLPPYREPDSVLAASIRGDYTLSAVDNSMKVYLTVQNQFDETLQGTASFRGTVEITSARDPRVVKTFPVKAQNLIQATGYQPATGRLTLNPGESLVFLFSWNFVDDRGQDLRRQFFRYVQDLSCSVRCLALPEPWVLTANVVIFDKTGNATTHSTYSLCFVTSWVNPRDCPPIITSAVCNDASVPNAPRCFPFPGGDQ